jgi:hypothetical protein
MADIIMSVKRPVGDDDNLAEIAKVSFGERGRLALLSANPAFQSVLENVLSAVNAQEELRIKVPPPPEAEPMSVHRASIKRDDPDLLDAMREYMEQKYDLHLSQDGEP